MVSTHLWRRHALRAGAVSFALAAASLAIPASSGLAMPMSSHSVVSAHSHHAGAHARVMQSDLRKLRHCESGGHWSENTGNGYYGAYQFAESTWRGLGFRGFPDDASPTRQNDAALKLHARDGWHPWPSCAAKEHLS